MKRHIRFAALMLTLVTMFSTLSATLSKTFANAAAASTSYGGFVRAYNYSTNGINISYPGSIARFTIFVNFPALEADDTTAGFHADGKITIPQLKSLKVEIGPDSSFGFAGGITEMTPFTDISFSAGTVSATFQLDLVFKGSPANDLELILSHDTKIADATSGDPITVVSASFKNSFFVIESLPNNSPEQTPDAGATPLLSATGNLPWLNAGVKGDIKFTLTNVSPHTANSVTVTLMEGEERLFQPTTVSGNIVSAGSMGQNGSRNVTLSVVVFEDIKEGYYTIPLSLSMRNNAGVQLEQKLDIQIYISNPKHTDEKGKASISVASATVDKNTPGSDGLITLTMAIANVGDANATDVRVSLTGFKSTEITLSENLVTKSLGNVAKGTQASATYLLKVAEGLESGSYALNAEIRYKQPDGTESTLTDIVYINIIRPVASQGLVQLSGISQNVSNPGSANVIKITLTVKNNGSSEVKDVLIGFEGLSSSSFTLSDGFGDMKLGNIAAGETADLTVALYVSKSLANGNYPLMVQLKYAAVAGGQLSNVETEVYVFVNRPEDAADVENKDSSVPRVIISKHEISEETVTAGNPFELNVTLLNTSTNKNVKNMKITVTDKDGIFIPVSGVNSFYVSQIIVGQTTDFVITLMPKQDAETKSFQVSISIDYEDEKNTAYSVVESLSIPVYQPQRLEVTNINFFEDGMGMGVLSFQFINKGKSSLYNMNIRVEGSMTAMEGDYYIGTFGPGQSDYYEDSIIPSLFGEIEGFVVIEYEDSAGTLQELRSPVAAFINEPYYPGGDEWVMDPSWPIEGEFLPDDGQMDGGGMPSWLSGWKMWAVIGVVVIAGIVTAVVLARRSKLRKAELDDYE